MTFTRRATALAFAGALLAPLAHAQKAPDFTGKTIRVIVPFTAGSGSDTSARYYGENMAKALGAVAVVENRPGGNGVIGVQALKQAPADGLTILLASVSLMTVNPHTMKDLPYDAMKDMRPIGGLGRSMNATLVPIDSKIKTPADFIAAAKATSRGLSVATYSQGYELAGEWLGSLMGAKLVNVPYKGQAPIMTDIIGNTLDAAIVDLGGAIPFIQDKKMRAVAVSGETRNPLIPDVPTWKESGFPNYVTYSWTSFYVRAETPDNVVDALATQLAKLYDTEGAKELNRRAGSEVMKYGPKQMRQYQIDETERYRKIAEAAGIKPQ